MGTMTHAEALNAIAWLRGEIKELEARQPGCSRSDCSVCQRYAAESEARREILDRLRRHLAGVQFELSRKPAKSRG